MFWIERAGEIAAAVLAIIGVLALIRNKIVRPVTVAYNRVVDIFEQLLSTAKFAREIARELREFSGAFTMFAVAIKQQVDLHADRIDRLEELRELVVDLQADVRRIEDRHGRRHGD